MYKKLLVPLDGSATAQLALRHAEALAKLSGASIILLSIVEEMHYSNGYECPKVYTEQVRPHFLATARGLLEKAAAPCARPGCRSLHMWWRAATTVSRRSLSSRLGTSIAT